MATLVLRHLYSIYVILYIAICEPKCFALNDEDLFPYGSSHGDSKLDKKDDDFKKVVLSREVNFFNKRNTTIYVSTNGGLSFNKGVTGYKPKPFPFSDVPILAPFWTDINIEKGGDIWYWQTTTNTSMLTKVTKQITGNDFNGISYTNYKATWMMVTTFDKVAFFNADDEGKKLRNTFQVVLVTNKTSQSPSSKTMSFAIYNYAKIEWTTGGNGGDPSTGLGGNASLGGFDAGNNLNYFKIPGSRTSEVLKWTQTTNTNPSTPGRWMWQISNPALPGNWGEWSCDCTVEGLHTKTRKCDHPPPLNGGKDCQGDKTKDSDDCTDDCTPVAPSLSVSAGLVDAGGQATFTCSQNGNIGKVKRYSFWKDDANLQNYTTHTNSATHVLQSVSTSDTGLYTCTVTVVYGINEVPSPHSKNKRLQVKPPKPTLVVVPDKVRDGLDVEFECNREGTGGSPTYKYFNGISCLTHFGTDHNYTKHGVTTANTSSTYNCKVTVNGVESDASNDVSLKVIPYQPTLTADQTPGYIVRPGTHVRVTCATSSLGPMTYHFLVNNETVGGGSSSYTHIMPSSDDQLTYLFTCTATVRGVQSVPSAPYNISVFAKPPQPILEVVPADARDGGDVEFKCKDEAHGNHGNITYSYFNGISHLTDFGTDSNYTKRGVTTADTGSTYNCKVTVNGVDSKVSDDAFLKVIPNQPALTADTPASSTIQSGSHVTFTCATSSQGSATYHFLVNNSTVAVRSGGLNTYTRAMFADKNNVLTCTATVNDVISVSSRPYNISVIDIDECLGVPYPCANGGTCFDLPLTFYCQCTSGYFGQRCEKTQGPLQPDSSPADDPFYANRTLGYYGTFAVTSLPPISYILFTFLLCDCCACFARRRIRHRNPDEWRRLVRRRNMQPSLAITRVALNALSRRKPIITILKDAFKPSLSLAHDGLPQQSNHQRTNKSACTKKVSSTGPKKSKSKQKHGCDSKIPKKSEGTVKQEIKSEGNGTEYLSVYEICEALLEGIPQDERDVQTNEHKNRTNMFLVDYREGSYTKKIPSSRSSPASLQTPDGRACSSTRGTSRQMFEATDVKNSTNMSLVDDREGSYTKKLPSSSESE